MFTYSKYCNDNLIGLKNAALHFFKVIHEPLINFETFFHGCLVRGATFIYAYFSKL